MGFGWLTKTGRAFGQLTNTGNQVISLANKIQPSPRVLE